MTREEAIKAWDKWGENGYSHSAMPNSMALVMAYNALRGPTREQAEKAWKTHWESVDSGRVARCANCGFEALYPEIYTFCPDCGKAFTDYAVDIAMKRLEAWRR